MNTYLYNPEKRDEQMLQVLKFNENFNCHYIEEFPFEYAKAYLTYYTSLSDYDDKNQYVNYINSFLKLENNDYTDEQINTFISEFRYYILSNKKNENKNLDMALWLFKDHIIDKFDFYTSKYVSKQFKFGYRYMLEYFTLDKNNSIIKRKIRIYNLLRLLCLK